MACEITGSPDANVVGMCAGAITMACLLGHLAATGDAIVNSATFMVAGLDTAAESQIGMLASKAAVEAARTRSQRAGVPITGGLAHPGGTAAGPAPPPGQHLGHRARLRRRPPPRVRRTRDPRLRALAFNLPLVWFFLPPPRDHRNFHHTTNIVSELYGIVFGEESQLGPLYDRLRQLGIDEPTEVDRTIENLTGKGSAPVEPAISNDAKRCCSPSSTNTSTTSTALRRDRGVLRHLRQVGVEAS